MWYLYLWYFCYCVNLETHLYLGSNLRSLVEYTDQLSQYIYFARGLRGPSSMAPPSEVPLGGPHLFQDIRYLHIISSVVTYGHTFPFYMMPSYTVANVPIDCFLCSINKKEQWHAMWECYCCDVGQKMSHIAGRRAGTAVSSMWLDDFSTHNTAAVGKQAENALWATVIIFPQENYKGILKEMGQMFITGERGSSKLCR